MRKWLRLWEQECGWLWRNPVLLLLPPLYGFLLFLRLARLGPPSSEDLYSAVFDFHGTMETLSLGLAIWLGLALLRRDVLRQGYEWLGTLPVSRVALVTAKYAAGFAYLSQFALLAAAVFAGFAVRRGLPGDLLLRHLGFFALQDEWSYGVTLALGMVLALLIPGRLAYLVAFCAWIFGTYFLQHFVIARYHWYFLDTFLLDPLLGDRILAIEAWGYSLLSRDLFLSRIFVAAFTLWLLACTTALLMFRWPAAARRKAVLAAAAALALAAVAYVPYGLLWQERYRIEASALRADGGDPEKRAPAVQFPVEAYRITLARGPNDVLSGTAELTLPASGLPRGGPVTFTLNRLLTVTRVQVDGKPVPWERSGDHLFLARSSLPARAGTVTVRVEYRGRLFDWLSMPSSQRLAAFVQGGDVYLPASQAWYPLPGRFYLKSLYPGYWVVSTPGGPNLPAMPPAAFRLLLRGFPGRVYATVPGRPGPGRTQIFTADQVDGLSLFGGNLTEVRLDPGGETVICSPSNVPEARRFVAQVDRARRYFASWLDAPRDRARRVIYLPLPPYGAVGDYPLSGSYGLSGQSLLATESTHLNLDSYRLVDVVHAWLFGGNDLPGWVVPLRGLPPDQIPLAQQIRRAFVYLYLRDGLGMAPDQALKLAGTIGDAVRRPIDEALRRGEAERVKGVLKAFYERYDLSRGLGDGRSLPAIPLQEWQKAWEVRP
ncbi:MAG: hypothetical protein QJR08_06635 [Bacillota bacterium]|nr:hypothetical protein [Bacillota bacterium]